MALTIFVFGEEFINIHVYGAIEQDRVSRFAIPASHELVLNKVPLLRGHACVIVHGCGSTLADSYREFFSIAAAGHVNDSGTFRSADPLQQPFRLFRFRLKRLHAKADIRTVEALDHNFLTHGFRSGRREGEDAGAAQRFHGSTQFEKMGAEIVTPFADAVGFIDHE